MSAGERFAYEMDVRQGEVRLLFMSPERLVQTDFYRVLQQIDVRTFAIDEAHCISHWGHDFRPEYRQLSRLREFFPQGDRPRLHGHGHRASPPGHHRATGSATIPLCWSATSIVPTSSIAFCRATT